MNRAWLARRRPSLARDLVRDYCGSYAVLTEQLSRFERDGTVSYAVVNALLGQAFSKGVLWRLKDTAHHLFRTQDFRRGQAVAAKEATAEEHSLGGELIDWCVGFAFHECIKLREDAYQRQHYANRLLHLERQWQEAREEARNGTDGPWPLAALPRQTADSMERELRRILRVLDNGLELLTRYLAREWDNGPLARWLAVEDERAASVFGGRWPCVLAAFEGRGVGGLYALAAKDLLKADRTEEALDLLRARRSLLGQAALALLRRLETGYANPVQATDAFQVPSATSSP